MTGGDEVIQGFPALGELFNELREVHRYINKNTGPYVEEQENTMDQWPEHTPAGADELSAWGPRRKDTVGRVRVRTDARWDHARLRVRYVHGLYTVDDCGDDDTTLGTRELTDAGAASELHVLTVTALKVLRSLLEDGGDDQRGRSPRTPPGTVRAAQGER